MARSQETREERNSTLSVNEDIQVILLGVCLELVESDDFRHCFAGTGNYERKGVKVRKLEDR